MRKEKNPRNPQQEQGGQLPTSRLIGIREVRRKSNHKRWLQGGCVLGIREVSIKSGEVKKCSKRRLSIWGDFADDKP